MRKEDDLPITTRQRRYGSIGWNVLDLLFQDVRAQIPIQQGKAIPNLLVVVDEGRRTASETRDEEIGSDIVDVVV